MGDHLFLSQNLVESASRITDFVIHNVFSTSLDSTLDLKELDQIRLFGLL